MISFFKKSSSDYFIIDHSEKLSSDYIKKISWIFGESKIINKSDPECDQQNNPRARSSAYCYECVYVFKLVNLKEERTISRFFPWSSKNDIGSELTKTMQMLAQHYFYSTK